MWCQYQVSIYGHLLWSTRCRENTVSWQYAQWEYLEKQINYEKVEWIDAHADEKILDCHTLFYTAPPVIATKLTSAIHVSGIRFNKVKDFYRVRISEKEKNTSNAFEEIHLIIVHEIDRLKLKH